MRKYLIFLTLFCASVVYGQFIISLGLTATFTNPGAKQNLPFTSTISVRGGDEHAGFTCGLTSGSFPTGITLSTCTVSGTPTGTTPASAIVTVTDSSSQTFPVTVSITPASLSSIAVTPVSQTIAPTATLAMTATGTWSDGSTSPLNGLCVWSSVSTGVATVNSSTGIVTGVAAGTSSIHCAFNAVIGATDVSVSSASPTVQTTTLQHAQINVPYPPQTLVASGGTPPYTFALFSGSLPTGLSMSSAGVITGTATGTTTTFSVKATDSLSNVSAAQSLTLTVATVSSEAVSLNPTTISVGSTSQATSTTTYSDSSTADTTNGSSLAVVNTATASNSSGSLFSSLQTGAFATVAHNALIVAGRHGTDFSSSITPSDLSGDSFVAGGALTANSPNLGAAQIWIAKDIAANSAQKVTCTYGASVAYDACIVLQITGSDNSSPVDVYDVLSNLSNTNNCISNPFSTTFANDILVQSCTAASVGIAASPGSGYTVNVTDADGLSFIESKIVSSIQSSVTSSSSFNGVAKPTITFTFALKAAVIGGALWSSSNPSIATVNGMGVVTGVGTGTSVITASVGGHTNTATITVGGGAVTSIAVSPSSTSAANGSNIQFTASDQSGNNITNSVTWSSGLPTCFNINSSGLANIISSSSCGSTGDVTATLGAISGSATLNGTGNSATILNGCTVSATNTLNCGTPAGWTLVAAEGFEGGSCSGNASCNGSPTTVKAHTGTKSLGGTYTGSEQKIGWTAGAGLINSRHWYLSYWEYLDCIPLTSGGATYGCMTDEQFIARPYVELSGGSLVMEVIFDWFNEDPAFFTNTPGNTGFEMLVGNLVMEPQEQVSPQYSHTFHGPNTTVGYGVGWQQWEIEFNPGAPNTNTCLANVWRNGTLMQAFGPVNCINDQDFVNQKLEVGGSYTYSVWRESGGACSTKVGGDAGGASNSGRYLNFSIADACANQAPPTGFGHSFSKYIDDIIVLKK